MISMLKKIRWRSKQIRYSQKIFRSILQREFDYLDPKGEFEAKNFELRGDLNLPKIKINLPDNFDLAQPFTDIKKMNQDYMEQLNHAVLKLPQLSVIKDYFPNGLLLWNVALNYSGEREYTHNAIESQLWHWDYGDARTIHLMINLEDVHQDSGPFTYIPYQMSKNVKRHPLWIERLTDSELEVLTGLQICNVKQQFTGSKGSFIFVDPGKILHQGARNIKSRLIAFYTFTTRTPYEINSEFESLKQKSNFWQDLEDRLNEI